MVLNYNKNVLTSTPYLFANGVLIIVLGIITYYDKLLADSDSENKLTNKKWIIKNLTYFLFSFYSMHFIFNASKLDMFQTTPKMDNIIQGFLGIFLALIFGILSFSNNIFTDENEIKTKVIKIISNFIFIYLFVWRILNPFFQSLQKNSNIIATLNNKPIYSRKTKHRGMMLLFILLIGLVVILNFKDSYNSDADKTVVSFIQRFGLVGIVFSIIVISYYMRLDWKSHNKMSNY